MDVEKMREVLATKCMGWTRKEGYTMSWYDDASGQDTGFYTVPEVIDPESDRRVWQPDRSWPQTGKILEMMQEKGWRLSALDVDGVIYDVEWIYDDAPNMAISVVVRETTFCAAVALAAARALEQEPTNGQ